MEDPLFCARCSCTLTPGGGSYYAVTIDAVADPHGPVIADELPSQQELRREIEALIAKLSDVTPREAMDQVHRRFTFHLCLKCYVSWIENPAGSR